MFVLIFVFVLVLVVVLVMIFIMIVVVVLVVIVIMIVVVIVMSFCDRDRAFPVYSVMSDTEVHVKEIEVLAEVITQGEFLAVAWVHKRFIAYDRLFLFNEVDDEFLI